MSNKVQIFLVGGNTNDRIKIEKCFENKIKVRHCKDENLSTNQIPQVDHIFIYTKFTSHKLVRIVESGSKAFQKIHYNDSINDLKAEISKALNIPIVEDVVVETPKTLVVTNEKNKRGSIRAALIKILHQPPESDFGECADKIMPILNEMGLTLSRMALAQAIRNWSNSVKKNVGQENKFEEKQPFTESVTVGIVNPITDLKLLVDQIQFKALELDEILSSKAVADKKIEELKFEILALQEENKKLKNLIDGIRSMAVT